MVTSFSILAETQHIHEARCYFDGTLVRVIDTPGFHDTDRGPESIATEIAKVERHCYTDEHIY